MSNIKSLSNLNPTTTQKKVGWDFWWKWLIANVFGLVNGGMLLPITQWLVLRNRVTRLPKTGWWVLATFLGFYGGLSVSVNTIFIIPNLITNPNTVIVTFTIFSTFALILSIMQWLLLRRWVYQSHKWIWTNVMGGLAAAIILNIWAASVGRSDNRLFAGFLVAFLVYIGITGFVLMRLLRNPISK
ncbi:MAG: hypothetical protein AAFV71_11960 [Cyanobacteria bacterium J06633_8]